ncbi:MAG TPA: TetR/AcrR family transcriptional regulator C-terminal domain-containing protein [Bosea sp. (in: a-proteobacteria)]|nr:TetR/AcrR family transcriptional regulator C-terminal domain-containing protein [Bosea sp. (in: a-proteobacteria)]
MARERTGAGDAAATLTLLWRQRPQSQRGPRPGLTVDAIVAAAIGIADAKGVEAVTMRAVALALSAAPMALYTHVPSKAELLDLMLDSLFLGMSRAEPAGDGWRDRLAAIARDNLALYSAHPWIASVATGRPPLGPGLMAKYEYELRGFDGLGLDEVETDAALTFLLGFVENCARIGGDARARAQADAMSDAGWWEANAPLLARVFDPARYPTATRVGAAAGAAHQGAYGVDHMFAFGLERVLDGIERLIERRTQRAGDG